MARTLATPLLCYNIDRQCVCVIAILLVGISEARPSLHHVTPPHCRALLGIQCWSSLLHGRSIKSTYRFLAAAKYQHMCIYSLLTTLLALLMQLHAFFLNWVLQQAEAAGARDSLEQRQADAGTVQEEINIMILDVLFRTSALMVPMYSLVGLTCRCSTGS